MAAAREASVETQWTVLAEDRRCPGGCDLAENKQSLWRQPARQVWILWQPARQLPGQRWLAIGRSKPRKAAWGPESHLEPPAKMEIQTQIQMQIEIQTRNKHKKCMYNTAGVVHQSTNTLSFI